ncbi:MAG: 3-hydroxyacyl-CoA dehydrogenase family protein [Synergistaceae bacterium]|jgi:3-hydroxybutyryl-CoA dehydrogenase|nr:3-hydroxyacyl-CoA dehydrogenase family protein [Synergistaceae bacterium]
MLFNDIKLVAVAGSGQMGADTATLCIGNGFRTLMLTHSEEGRVRGLNSVRNNFAELKGQGLLNDRQIETALSRLRVEVGMDKGADAEFIFEAVVERPEVKIDVYRQLEAVCRPDAIFASITSGISPDILAEGIARKDRLIVTHSWNPAHLIPLVEVVRSRHTSDETTQTAVDLLKAMKREVVVLKKNIPGFIGNRLMHAMFREALYLVENGYCDPEDVDRTVYYSFGQRYSSVGLLEYFDSVGLDLDYNVESYLFETLCDAKAPQKYLVERYQRGDLGPKTGRGVFDWTKKDLGDFRTRKNRPFFKMFNWNIDVE